MKFMKNRQERILTQIMHLKKKQSQEMRELEIKLDRIYKEQERERSSAQQKLL